MSRQRELFPPPARARHPRGRPRGTRVQHVRRPAVSLRAPRHVTVRMRRGVWNLRSQRCFRRIAAALRAVQRREGFHVTHFSVQGNHVHLLVEAESRAALSNGMRALLIRIARSLNELMGARGRLYEDRFHERAITSRRQVLAVIRYVLENHARHMRELGKGAPAIDPFSSAARAELVSDARSWLVRSAFS